MTQSAMNQRQCLTDETLTDYLEGGLDPAVKAATEAHLVGCDNCRVRLAFFMRLLRDEVRPEESAAVAAIQAEWVRTRNDRGVLVRRGSGCRRWKIAAGGVAAAFVLAAGSRLALEHAAEPKTAHEVIHLLLAESRPFEARISGQPFLPYTATRGTSDSGSMYSLLAGQMNRLSASTYEMGQFYLLQKDFKNAITYLELASHEAGASAEVLNDLGVAYMESGAGANLQKAVAEFRRSLASRPSFAPAAFNLAVAYQRMGKNDLAEMEWMQYLRLEPERTWKDEAKSKLEAITR